MDARARIIDAYIALLHESGERAATIDAVAARAELSKGGLLYHFPSVDDLILGLIERVESLENARYEQLRSSPDGPAAAYLGLAVGAASPLGRTLVALARISNHMRPECARALVDVRHRAAALIEQELGDPTLARVTMALGDGLNFASIVDEEGAAEHRDAVLAEAVTMLDGVRSRGRSAEV